MRKLVTIRTVSAVDPIPDADTIECLTVEGWKVVSQKGNFKPGDPCVYFEIDSFLPDGNPLWQDLVDKSSRVFMGEKGHVLKTIKLRGQVSQGFCIPLHKFPSIISELGIIVKWTADNEIDLDEQHEATFEKEVGRVITKAIKENFDIASVRDRDFSELLGVIKYEPPIPAQLAGQVKGSFPSIIRKTDQERYQNMMHEICEDIDAVYEESVKFDGASMTTYHDPEGTGGVCSRNFEMKTSEGVNDDNSMVKLARECGLLEALKSFPHLAVQGELMGPAIQGNREQLKVHKYFVFDIYDIWKGEYLAPTERREVFAQIQAAAMEAVGWVDKDKFPIQHVPVLNASFTLREHAGFVDAPKDNSGFSPTYDAEGAIVGGAMVSDYGYIIRAEEHHAAMAEKLQALSDGPSIVHPVREGLVFKRHDGKFSFKVISNSFLLKQKD